MSRLEIMSPTRARIVMEGLYKDLERRIESSPPGLCPVDMARAFLELCHAQTCGKCVPCRIGLGQLNQLIRDVLNGKATMDTLDLMEKTASWTPPTAPSAMRQRTWSTRDSSATAMTMWSTSGTGAVPVPTTSRFPVSRSARPMWTFRAMWRLWKKEDMLMRSA